MRGRLIGDCRPVPDLYGYLSERPLCRKVAVQANYPASPVLRTSLPPQGARPVPHGCPVGHPSPRQGASRVACVSLLCTCCRHYPGTVTEDTALLISPVLSAFPAMAGRSACATSFSRIAQRSLTLRPAHSPSHLVTLYTRGFSHFVTSMTAPIASGWSTLAGWDSHPLRNAALTRRTPESDIHRVPMKVSDAAQDWERPAYSKL